MYFHVCSLSVYFLLGTFDRLLMNEDVRYGMANQSHISASLWASLAGRFLLVKMLDIHRWNVHKPVGP